jgi:putative hemolysin
LQPIRIDIAKVLADKSPTVARLMPRFVLNWLKRTIHEEEINVGLEISKDLKDLEFASWVLNYLKVKAESSGREHIPTQGGCIVASNHPLGGLDGVALMQEAGKARPDVRFIVNDILTNLPNFEKIVVGVNKHGSNPRAGLEAIEQAYSGGHGVLIFPAGLCSRKQDDSSIKDLVWHKSFIARAQKYNLPVVPTFINGRNSNWFYNLARWRKKLGIKANLEMLYLPDEMFKQRGQNIQITFGPVIPAAVFDKSRKQDEWAALLRDFVYLFPSQPGLLFQDFIKNK